jgi:hypothetical protein
MFTCIHAVIKEKSRIVHFLTLSDSNMFHRHITIDLFIIEIIKQ